MNVNIKGKQELNITQQQQQQQQQGNSTNDILSECLFYINIIKSNMRNKRILMLECESVILSIMIMIVLPNWKH